MTLLKIEGRYLNLDYLVDAQRSESGATPDRPLLTLRFACSAPPPLGIYDRTAVSLEVALMGEEALEMCDQLDALAVDPVMQSLVNSPAIAEICESTPKLVESVLRARKWDKPALNVLRGSLLLAVECTPEEAALVVDQLAADAREGWTINTFRAFVEWSRSELEQLRLASNGEVG